MTVRKIFAAVIVTLLSASCGMGNVDVYVLARSGSPKQLKEAVRKGADFSVRCSFMEGDTGLFDEDETPLHIAAAYNRNAESIRIIASQGLDVNAEAGSGNSICGTPLSCAVQHKNITAAGVLLELGAAPDGWTFSGWYSGTAFHDVAAWYDDKESAREIISKLIKAGGNVNVHEEDNDTAKFAREEIKPLKDELKPGPGESADGDTRHVLVRKNTEFSRAGWLNFSASCTPLIFAVLYDNPDAVNILLDFGADAGIKSAEGKNACDYAEELPGNSRLRKSPAYVRLKRAVCD